jgi:hypothetical protein
VAAVEMLRPLPQAAEVDDPLDAGRRRGGGEVLGGLVVALGEVAIGAATHRVDQVVGDVDPLQCRAERLGLEHVSLDDLATGLTQIVGALGTARQRPHLLAVLAEAVAEQASDVAGGASNRDHAL